jgi:hypothetical protein
MSTATLQKQFIIDARGRQIGVILPIEDYMQVEPILRQYEQSSRNDITETEQEKLRMIERAASDPLFLADLQEMMNAFEHVDAEWWERSI